MNNFCIFGVAGYIAPRHLEAIKVSQGNLVAAFDLSDSVGILDKYFSDALYFRDLERFDRFVYKMSKSSHPINFATICTPNYLHDSHSRMAMRNGCDVICEKPLVLNPLNLDALQQVEYDTGKRVFSVLQLRYHPVVLSLKRKIDSNKIYEVDLTYITPRGAWYEYSWKGDIKKSGGLPTNIGVHLFDLLFFLFGKHEISELHYADSQTSAGYLEFKNARVRWFLSTDAKYLSGGGDSIARPGAMRSMIIDKEIINFSEGFTDLHNKVYEEILSGNGYGLSDCRESIQITSDLRVAKISSRYSKHPLARGLVDVL